MTTRAVLLVALATATLAPVAPARAQHPAYAAGLPAELDSVTSAALLREVERASARGLPVEPLLAKAREGRLKRAPGPRIRQAVAALSARLDSARAALGADASSDELVAGSDALSAGAGIEALRAVRAAAAHEPVAVPLGTLAQLVASGVTSRRATAMIVELLRRHATPAMLVAFGNAVEGDAAGGLPADQAAIFRLRSASTAVGGSTAGAPSATDVTAPPPQPPSPSPRRRP